MEKRMVLAFALSLAVIVVWSVFFTPKSTPPAKDQQAQTEQSPTTETGATTAQPESGAPAAVPAQPGPTTVPQSAEKKPARDVVVKTDLYTAVFTERGGRLKSMTLNKYQSSMEPDSPPQELVAVESTDDLPLGLSFLESGGPGLKDSPFVADKTELEVTGAGKSADLKMVYQSPEGFQVIRTYKFTSDSYLVGMEIQLVNLSPNTFKDSLVVNLNSDPITKKLRYAGFGAYIDGKLVEVKADDVAEEIDDLKQKNYMVTWAGYQDQYFLVSLLPEDQEKIRLKAETYNKQGISVQFINPTINMPPQHQKSYKYQIFYGPKDLYVLKNLGHDLEKSVSFGWVDILSKPLLIFMIWLHRFVGNYGVVIIIITIIIKVLFWPLTAKSYKSMKGMKKLQPKIMKIREKHKNDRQAMNAEMMELYRAYKVNPMGGCLPMVIQIPVFIALYRLLDYSLELRHAPFWLWITDLSAPDRLLHFDFKIPFVEPPTGIPVLTLLMGACMLLQQKMTPTPGDPTQAKMMMLMPIFFTFIFINFPAGLVLYWLINNILSIGQQVLINRSPD